MNDEKKIDLARAIHGTPHATRTSFTATSWAGVERAWEWIGKNYQPKDESVFLNEYQARLERQLSMNQDDRVWQGPTSMTMEPPMKQENDLGDNDVWQAPTTDSMEHSGDAFPYMTAHVKPWTAEQREAACDVRAACWMKEDGDAPELCAAIAKVAPLFVSPPPVPSVEECERAYSKAWHDDDCARNTRSIENDVTCCEAAGIAAVRAMFVQGDGGGGSTKGDANPIGTAPSPTPPPVPSVPTFGGVPLIFKPKLREEDLTPTPAPDREAMLPVPCVDDIADCMSKSGAEFSHEFAEIAVGMYAQPIRTRDDRIATLTKERDEARGKAIDVEACAREIVEEILGADSPWKIQKRNTAAILRKHFTSKARSVTREQLSGAMADVFGSYHRRTIERTDMENAILRHLCS